MPVKASIKTLCLLIEPCDARFESLAKNGCATSEVKITTAIVARGTYAIGPPSIQITYMKSNAKGKSIINRIYHIDRGYEEIEKKISQCGGNIRRIK